MVKKVKQQHGGGLIQMEKGDPPLNPYGRPPRMVSQILRDMKADGMEAVTPGQVSDVISVLLNYPVESVKKMAGDSTLPIIVQRTARRFAGASDKDWDTVIKDNLDRAHGKPTNRHEVAGKDGEPIKFEGVSLENKLAALALLEGKNDGI